ncbi:hypothetical protein [Actinoalloteichus spitiensis]|uniref:hypothetical protein n=1 Tax=Actinoalloteichus spitiensis TaxID=252394 RepID=UPI00037B0C22|nr:hypothetical protein [Actinoalloteichus spitiensis]
MTEPTSAADAYKEICGLVTDAVDRLRERDEQRAEQLRAELLAAEQRREAAAEREHVTRWTARLRWEAAVELLWDQRWLRMTPLPRPDRSTPYTDLDACGHEVDAAFEELKSSLERRGLFRRRQQP